MANKQLAGHKVRDDHTRRANRGIILSALVMAAGFGLIAVGKALEQIGDGIDAADFGTSD